MAGDHQSHQEVGLSQVGFVYELEALAWHCTLWLVFLDIPDNKKSIKNHHKEMLIKSKKGENRVEKS